MRLVQPATVETIQGIVKTLKDSFGFIERADVEKDVRFFTAHFLSHAIVQSALFIPLLFFPTCESVFLLICMWNIFNMFLYNIHTYTCTVFICPPFSLSVCRYSSTTVSCHQVQRVRWLVEPASSLSFKADRYVQHMYIHVCTNKQQSLSY